MHDKEIIAQRAIEDRGFTVHNANIIFRSNCPNIDLVVFAKNRANYIQVKSSSNPAGNDSIIIEGSPWTHEQLYENAPVFNKHNNFQASFIVIVDASKSDAPEFYIAPPAELEKLVRDRAVEFAAKPKKDGTPRAITFRKELPRQVLEKWRGAWHLLGDPTVDIKC